MAQPSTSKLMVLIQTPDSEKLKSTSMHSDKIKNLDGECDNYVEDTSVTSQPPSPEIMSPPSFCTMSNFQSFVVHLSQELQNLGFSYKLIEANGEKLNLVALVNACWNIIQLYHNAVKDGNILHDSRRRDAADINHLQGSVRGLKLLIEDKDRLFQEAQEKERQANSMNKALAGKLKLEKDEIRRLNSILQQREAQHQHESRKKELEMNKLQDRLHRFVSGERSVDTRMPTLTISGGSLNRPDRARGRWRTDNASLKQEEELYRRVLGQYETWVGQLTEEGDLLRDCLASVAGKISKMAVKCANSQIHCIANEKDFLNDSLACSVLSSDGLDDEPIYSLNFLSVKDRIQKNLDDNLQLIYQVLEEKCSQIGKEGKKNQTPCDDVADSSVEGKPSFEWDASFEKRIEELSEGLCIEKEAELKDKMRRLSEMRRRLQEERETFAAAAVRLNRERAAFEAEKVELLRHHFLEELSSFPTNDSKDPFTPNTSLESSLNQSLNDLYGDSPHNVSAIPILVSPTGTVTNTHRPVTLGPTRLPRHHRESQPGMPKSVGGRSEPSTRNSSSSRSTEMRFLHDTPLLDTPRAKTLERPTPSFRPRDGGISSHSRLLSRSAARSPHPLSLFPSICSLTQSVNCPPLETKGARQSPERDTAEFFRGPSPLSAISPPRRQHPFASTGHGTPLVESNVACNEELLSQDSGFNCDCDALSSVCGSFLRNAQTNSRLNAIENSLTTLLRQIDVGQQEEVPESGGECPEKKKVASPSREAPIRSEVSAEAASGRFAKPRRSSIALLKSKPSRITTQVAQPPIVSAWGAPPDSPAQRFAFDRRHVRLSSAPGSLGASRRPSRDQRTGEDYLKKIQSNIAKWYWK